MSIVGTFNNRSSEGFDFSTIHNGANAQNAVANGAEGSVAGLAGVGMANDIDPKTGKPRKDKGVDAGTQALIDDVRARMDDATRDLYDALGHDIRALRESMDKNRERYNKAGERKEAAFEIITLIESGEFDPNNEDHVDLLEQADIGMTAQEVSENPDEAIRQASQATEEATDEMEALDADFARLEGELEIKEYIRDRLEPGHSEELSLEQAQQMLASKGYEITHDADGNPITRVEQLLDELNSDNSNVVQQMEL